MPRTRAAKAQAQADALTGEDDEHLIIVSCAVTNQPPDQQHLPPLVEQIRRNCGRYPDKLLADAGYWDEHPSAAENAHLAAWLQAWLEGADEGPAR